MVARVTGPTPAAGVLDGTYPGPGFSPAGEAEIDARADVLVDAEAALRAAADTALDAVALKTTGDQTAAGTKNWTGAQRITSGEPRYDVKGFGPSATAAERRTTLQAAIDAWGATGGQINLHGAYDISGGSVTLPPLALGTHTCFEMRGSNNATLSTTSAHPLITDSVPPDTTVLTARANRRFVFESLRLKGSSDPTQTLLRIIGSYGTEVRNVVLEGGGDGIDLIFALQPVVRNVKSKSNVGRSLRLRSANGIVAGANGANSGTNCAHVSDFRDYCSAAQPASIHLFEADGAIFDNLITEGADPVDSVIFDANSNPTVKTLELRGWHNEHSPSGAGLRIRNMAGGVVKVARPFWQTAQTLIDATDNNTAAVLLHVEDVSFIPANPFLAGAVGGCGWLFTGTTGSANMRATSHWVGATVPTGACQVAYDGSTGLVMRASSVAFVTDAAFGSLVSTHSHSGGYDNFSRVAIGAAALGGLNPSTLPASSVLTHLDEASGLLNLLVTDSSSAQWTIPVDYKSSAILSSSKVTANTQTGSYTTVLSDAGKVVEMNAAGANTLTIPPNASVAYPIGTVIEAYQVGAGQTTITPGAGVTLTQREGKLKLAGQGASASLRKRATNEWVVSGDLSA